MNSTKKQPKIMRRFFAVCLSFLILFSLFPTSVFAWSGNAGEQANSYRGSNIVSIDGGTYSHPSTWKAVLYAQNGSKTLRTIHGGGAYYNFMLSDSSGSPKRVYCVESGVTFGSTNGYLSENGTNSQYLNLLTQDARDGIALATLYGWREGVELPISGINADDYYMATQAIIWEYQQELRTNPHNRQDNGTISMNQFFDVIKGRPAEKAYNWILDQIATHKKVPSFASDNAANAPTHRLKYNVASGNYSLTLTDTNNTGLDLKITSGSGVSVTRNGNQYTFTSANMIENAIAFSFQKDITANEPMLIWGHGGSQTMLTGASDFVSYYLNIDTETFGTLKLFKTSEDGEVANISFTIKGNGIDKTVTTNENGEIEIDDLTPAEYTITEIPIDKYVTPTAQTVQIVSGQTSTVNFSNILKKFQVTVTKKDSQTGTAQGNATLAGAVYGIYQGTTLVDTYTTDENGIFTTKYYVCGDHWTVREITPSEGYLLDSTVYTVGAQAQNFTIELNPISTGVTEKIVVGNILLVKHIDVENPNVEYNTSSTAENPVSEQEQASSTTENPVSEQEQASSITDSPTLESEPVASTTENSETQSISISESAETASTVSEPQADSADKLDSTGNQGIIEQPESGAKFELYLKSAGSYENAKDSERDVLVTDTNGFAKSKNLPYGWYTVHQIEGLDGHAFVPDFTVYIAENGKTYSYILNNTSITAKIRIEKRDAETGKLISVAGIGFKIKDSNGEYISQHFDYPTPTDIDTFYTNDEGWLMLPEPLKYGTYYLEEVQTAQGYVLGNEIIEFKVDGNDAVVTVVKNNMPQMGIISINKTGEVFSSVQQNGEQYQPIFNAQSLEGAVFEVIATEDIYTLDGTLRAKKGDIVDTITTNVNGYAETKPLYLGKYEVKEKKAPNGYVLSKESKLITISYAGQELEIAKVGTCFFNERQKVAISLLKELEKSETYKVGTNNEITNVKFGLYSADKKVAADGTQIPKDGLIQIMNVNADGTLVFSADVPFGKYYVKEIESATGYILSDKKYEIDFSYQGQDVAIVELAVNNGNSIENKLLTGKVKGLKVDERDIPLTGAVIGIFKESETEFTKENALQTVTTDTNGVFAFENVPFGNWIIKEIQAPSGYILSDTKITVTINDIEKTVEIKIVNHTAEKYGILVIHKTSSDVKLQGFSFRVQGTSGTGVQYDKTFITDINGSIRIEDIPTGSYTVSEVKNSASSKYVLPKDQTVTIKVSETSTLNFYNEINNAPKTGDSNNLVLWAGVLSVSLGAVITFAILRKRKKASLANTDNEE